MIVLPNLLPSGRSKLRAKIVIAHADDDVLHDLEVGLLQSGFSTFSADSGITCIKKLKQCFPEILLLDAHLLWGGCDGVLALMETNNRLYKTRIIILDDVRRSFDFQALRNFAVSDVLILPIPMHVIADRCIELIEVSVPSSARKVSHSSNATRLAIQAFKAAEPVHHLNLTERKS